MQINLALFSLLLLLGSVTWDGVLLPEARKMLVDLRWYMLLCLFITLLDLYYGIKESHKKGIEVRTSRALRRTGDKVVNYALWLLVSGCFYQAFGAPLGDNNHILTAIVMSVAIFIEIKSVLGHVAVLYGLDGTVLGKILAKIIGKKVDRDVGESIEETIEETKEKENNQSNRSNPTNQTN